MVRYRYRYCRCGQAGVHPAPATSLPRRRHAGLEASMSDADSTRACKLESTRPLQRSPRTLLGSIVQCKRVAQVMSCHVCVMCTSSSQEIASNRRNHGLGQSFVQRKRYDQPTALPPAATPASRLRPDPDMRSVRQPIHVQTTNSPCAFVPATSWSRNIQTRHGTRTEHTRSCLSGTSSPPNPSPSARHCASYCAGRDMTTGPEPFVHRHDLSG